MRNPYIPTWANPFTPEAKTRPSPKQVECLSYFGDECLFGGAAFGGKALYNGSLVPTPAGWKILSDLRPGDQVFGMDGKPTEVLAVSEVMTDHECWRLTFDDGSTVVADAEHGWLTYDTAELFALTRRDPAWRAARRARRPSRVSGKKSALFTASLVERNKINPPPSLPAPAGTVRTTREIAATLCRHNGRTNHAVPVGGSLDLPDVDLPIDPYVLGAWLGDGTSRNAGFTTADPEMVAMIQDAGWPVSRRGGKQPYAWVIGTNRLATLSNGRRGLRNDFADRLRSLGVLGNKHVPAVYFRASRAQRLALLQGLMDTDGTVAKASGSAEFTSTNVRLAEAVVELACSLGHKANLREGVAKLKRRVVGPKWTVKWLPSEIVFRLPRKAILQKLGTRQGRFRYIVGCDRVESVPVQCIKVVATDGMFLAGSTMIPTHNSDFLVMAALQYVHVPGYRALLIRRTFRQLFADDGLYQRLRTWIKESGHGDDVHWDGKSYRFTFPPGSTISFLYLDAEKDKDNFQGPGWQFIGVDELTQFPENWYTYLFSRLRRLTHLPVPLRLRAGSNPGRIGHEWVKRRFIAPGAVKQFVAAKLEDNPGADRDSYIRTMTNVDPIERAQLLAGDWDSYEGGRFRREWFREFGVLMDRDGQPRYYLQVAKNQRGTPIYEHEGIPVSQCWNFLVCDPAARAEESNDYTVIGTFAVTPNRDLLVLDILRERMTLEKIVPAIADLCDGYSPSWVAIEDSGFQAGIINDARKNPRIPAVRGINPEGKAKLARAIPAIIRAEAGQIYLPEKSAVFPWIDDFLAELVQFTGDDKLDAHDDQVDTLAYATQCLDRMGVMAPVVVESESTYVAGDPYGERVQRGGDGWSSSGGGFMGGWQR